MKTSATDRISTREIGAAIDDMVRVYEDARRPFERRWYDNNFFDDGYHYRYLQRSTNKIVDLSDKGNIYSPSRAIPKASKQIRGVANLLLSNDPTPVVYPEKVLKSNYTSEQEYLLAVEAAKKIAKKTGHWLTEEFKDQNILEKLALAVILSCKHGVSYIKIWPDSINEKINTTVRDAFDVYLMGSLNEIYDSPSMVEITPRLIAEIKADENFDEEERMKISPDNKSASSEIKQAYMSSRFANDRNSDMAATLLQKEAFIREYLNESNVNAIMQQDDAVDILEGKKRGDIVIRQVFTAGGLTLRDRYISLPDYPYVDFRMEPGPIYQVPLIERFIPTNKSLDLVVSRVERWTHTMAAGSWSKRKGEQFKISNQAGGVIYEYDATAPVQNRVEGLPNTVFNFIGLLNNFIDEQGVSLSTLNKIPNGVKAASAIESLKESEYASLVIASRRLKGTVKRVAEKMLDLADSYFTEPQTVYLLEKGEPQYFDIIGNSAKKQMEAQGLATPDAVPIKKEYKVEIEIESGMGYTRSGREERIMRLGEFIRQLAAEGHIPPEAVALFVEKMLETFQFGSTADFMDAIDKQLITGNLSDKQIEAIKVSVAEVFQDLLKEGVLPDQDQRIEEIKVGVAETMKDSGLMDKEDMPLQEPPKISITYKDLPPEGQAQAAAMSGIEITPEDVRSQQQLAAKLNKPKTTAKK